MNKSLRLVGIVLLCIAVGLALTGCSFGKDSTDSQPKESQSNQGSTPGQGGDQPVNNNDELKQWDGVKGKVITNNYPAEIVKYLEDNKTKETQQTMNINNRTYLIVTMGERPSAGYSLELQNLALKDGTLKAKVKYQKPGKDDITATVITYPSLVVETDDIYEGHYMIEFDIEK